MKIQEERLEKINALARKEKAKGLTEQEKQAQKELREAYLKTFRASLRQTLEHTVIVDHEGNRKPLKKGIVEE